MIRTSCPCGAASDHGFPLLSVDGERRARGGYPAERPERRQVDPVDGRLVGPALCHLGGGTSQFLSAFQRATTGSSRRKTGRSRSARSRDRHELAIGVAGFFFLAGGHEDLDQGGHRRHQVGVLVHALPGRALGETKVAGREVGPRQRLGPHGAGLGELIERRADLAAGQELVTFQLGEGGPLAAGRVSFLRASTCSASFLESFLAA